MTNENAQSLMPEGATIDHEKRFEIARALVGAILCFCPDPSQKDFELIFEQALLRAQGLPGARAYVIKNLQFVPS